MEEENIEKCWKILSECEMKLNLRFTGHEYTDTILTKIQESIRFEKEQLKLLLKIID